MVNEKWGSRESVRVAIHQRPNKYVSEDTLSLVTSRRMDEAAPASGSASLRHKFTTHRSQGSLTPAEDHDFLVTTVSAGVCSDTHDTQ